MANGLILEELNSLKYSTIFDFTGDMLSVMVNNGDSYENTKQIPFNVTITKKDFEWNGHSLDLYRKEKISLYDEHINIPRFHNIFSIICHDRELSSVIWRAFFFTNRDTFLNINNFRNVLMITPIKWEPLINLAMIKGFSDVFYQKPVNMILHPVLALFDLIEKSEQNQKLTKLNVGQTFPLEYCLDKNFHEPMNYQYLIERKKNTIDVMFDKWEEVSKKSDESSNLSENKYQAFSNYSSNPKNCRIEFFMDLNFGVNTDGEKVKSLITPQDALGKSCSYRFKVCNNRSDTLNIPIVAWMKNNEANLFQLCRCLIPKSPEFHIKDFVLNMKHINYENGFIEIFSGYSMNPIFESFFPLPRLVR